MSGTYARLAAGTAACLLSVLALAGRAGADTAPIGAAVEDLPIFDAHMHYKEPAWAPYPVASVIELMDRNRVAMALVSSTPDQGTIMLWQYAPSRIVPELRPYHGDTGSSNWTKAPDMAAYLQRRLASYPHQGIGEFHIHRLDMADAPLFRQVIAMARARDIPLHVHSGPEAVQWLYGLDPEVRIIWAHAGLGESAAAVYRLMAAHPDLLADTSLRESDILGPGDALDPDWERIVIEFQDRLMVGSDTWVNGQWDRYDDIMASNRRWLAKLPREIAEKIAFGNAARVFGREVTMDLIGKR